MEQTPREKGLALFEDIYGPEMTRGLEANLSTPGTFASLQSQWTVDFAFGEVWSREALARKARSCAVIGMLIAQRAHEELVYHTRMGLANGLTRSELEELVYTAIPYCGFPAAQAAKAAMLEAFAAIDGDRGPASGLDDA